MEILGSLNNTIISSTNKDALTSTFLICMLLISFSCLIALAKISFTVLNRYGESGWSSLVFGFSGIALSFFPFKLMFAIGLL